jgi:hypothetical protein
MDNSTTVVLDKLENQLYELVEKMHQLQQSKVALETSLLEAQSKLKAKQEMRESGKKNTKP